jgi:hypothetical protein
MNRSWRTFTLVAFLGLSGLFLAQSSAHAQYRRPYVPVVRPPYFAPYIPPRALVATPPPIVPYANSFTYTPYGLNLNQAAALNALRIQTQLYNPYSLYGYTTPGLYYNSYLYNPYSYPFGFR